MRILVNAGVESFMDSSWVSTVGDLCDQGHQIVLLNQKKEGLQLDLSIRGLTRIDVDIREGVDEPFPIETVKLANDFWLSVESSSFRFVALKMMNRVDFSGTFRMLDREVLLSMLVLRLVNEVQQVRPHLVIFDVTAHEFFTYTLRQISLFFGIQILSFVPSPISPSLYPKFEPEIRTGTAIPMVSEWTGGDSILGVAREKIEALQNNRRPTYIVAQRLKDAELSSRVMKLISTIKSARWLLRPRFGNEIVFTGHDPKPFFPWTVYSTYLNWSLATNLSRASRSLREDIEIAAEDYALFALHYEPERTSLPDGLPILFQGDAVIRARDLIPLGTPLIVKEHYSQASSALRGYLGRSKEFYPMIRSLPNTHLVGGEKDGTELLSGASIVFTLTGTIAIESVLKGVPVGFFGSPWWEGLPGTLKVGNHTTINDLQSINVPDPEDISSFLLDLVSEKMIPGISLQGYKFATRLFGELPAGIREAESRALLACVQCALDEALEKEA